jgi:prepilin-type N-terminal cleavage/methylation domain-containing protein
MMRSLRATSPVHARRGVSLIEVMFAMTMLAIVLVTIAKLSLDVATTGRANDLVARRTAVLQQQAARLGAIPYTTLQTMTAGTATITAGGVSYVRRIGLTQGTNRISVKIVIAPSSDTTKKDSLMFDHAYSNSSPLCSGC